MQNILKLLVIGLFFAGLSACVKEPNYPLEPEIEYITSSKLLVQEGDSFSITFRFTDGDGNIGFIEGLNSNCSDNNCEYESDSTCFKDAFYSCFLIDQRDSCFASIAVPDVEPSGNIKAVSGELEVAVPPVFCKCVCDFDTLKYQIIVKDRTNNYSNVILSEAVIVDCL